MEITLEERARLNNKLGHVGWVALSGSNSEREKERDRENAGEKGREREDERD